MVRVFRIEGNVLTLFAPNTTVKLQSRFRRLPPAQVPQTGPTPSAAPQAAPTPARRAVRTGSIVMIESTARDRTVIVDTICPFVRGTFPSSLR
jgi:hypothetical protein